MPNAKTVFENPHRRRQIAEQNSLKKAADHKEYEARRELKMHLAQLREIAKLGSSKEFGGRTKELRNEINTRIKTIKNSIKRFGAKNAKQRLSLVSNVRRGRSTDRFKAWGWSYDADLKTLRKYYYPINLERIIQTFIRKSKSKPVSVLEIGAGTGRVAEELAKKYGKSTNIIATSLRRYSEWTQSTNSQRVNYKLAHAENLQRVAAPNSIEIIHSNLGIAHSADLELALKETLKVLKPKGILIFTVPGALEINIPKGFRLLKYYASNLKVTKDKDVPMQRMMLQKE